MGTDNSGVVYIDELADFDEGMYGYLKDRMEKGVEIHTFIPQERARKEFRAKGTVDENGLTLEFETEKELHDFLFAYQNQDFTGETVELNIDLRAS